MSGLPSLRLQQPLLLPCREDSLQRI